MPADEDPMSSERATTWLRRVEKELAHLPKASRTVVVSNLREHIREGLDHGASTEEILAHLGTPQEVAAASDPVAPLQYFTPRRLAQVVALALVAAATLILLFVPLGTVVTETADSSNPGQTQTQLEGVSLLAEGGPSVVVPLTVPVLAAALPLVVGRRQSRGPAIASAVVLGIFMVLGMLSVGIFYAPAFVAACVGVFVRGTNSV